MSASFSQRFLHWLELGGGSRLVVRLSVILVAAILLFYAGWQRFEGPDDRTMEQAVVARGLAEGKGYSTTILWPQSVAVLKESGFLPADWQPGGDATVPELHQAPGYATVMGAAMKLLGEGGRSWLFTPASMEAAKITMPYRADLLLLGLNALCGLVVAVLSALLAERIFNIWAGGITLAGVVTSLSLGESLAAVDGTLLVALGAVVLAWTWERMVNAGLEKRSLHALLWTFAGALTLAGLYLTEYVAGLLLFPWLVSAAWALSGNTRWLALVLGLATFVLGVLPWTVRNVSLTGHPMALAGQALALKKGDPTAEPLSFRNTDSTAAPVLSVRKILNKGFKGLEGVFASKIWSGGAQFLGAFAVAGLLYRFRQARTTQVRWGWMAAWLFVVLGQLFVSSGESPRLAVIWLSPWLIILGSGFFMILLENLRQPTPVMRAALVALLVFLNALPIVHHISEPQGRPFPATLHLPGRMSSLGQISGQEFRPGYLFVTDAPAALTWYGRVSVWSLPGTYGQLADLHRRHMLSGLLLTSRTMEQPLYSKLIPQAREEAEKTNPGAPLSGVTGWAPVWSEILRQVIILGQDGAKLPRGFPFGRMILLPELGLGETVLFLNPMAQKRPMADGR